MNKYVPATLTALLLAVTAFSLTAQYTDTLPAAQYATKLSLSFARKNTATDEKNFPYKSFFPAAALVVYGFISLHTDAFQDVNETIQEEVYTEHKPRQLHIDNYLQYAPALAVYGLNTVGIQGLHNFRDRSIIYSISTLIMSTTVFSVKKMTAETRPDRSNNLSFPSGHTAEAFASAEFLRKEYQLISPWYGIAGYAVATVTGYLRISNNKHWLGDVVAGAGTGIISTNLAYWIYPAIKRNLLKNKKVNMLVMPMYQNRTWSISMVQYF